MSIIAVSLRAGRHAAPIVESFDPITPFAPIDDATHAASRH
ncbi:MAG: hypothetical protein ACTS3F_13035 [Phycisphaerales bacterium]